MKRKLFVLFSMFAIVAIAFTSCQKDNLVVDQKDAIATSVSEAGITPVLYTEGNGGNVECSELDVDYEFSSGRINYDEDEDIFDADFPAGFTITTDGTSVTWSYTPVDGMCLAGVSVIVKGGPAANVYTYEAGINGDSGLVSPDNESGGPAGLSNLTFCYNLVECEEEECYEYHEETAWAGIAGDGAAWWFYIEINENGGSYPIYAGQELVEDAYVIIDADGILTIDLGDNLMLQDVNEAVKIQGYNTIPTRRPNAGRFTTYKGDLPVNGDVDVSDFIYVAIHLDALVKVLVDCPEGEE